MRSAFREWYAPTNEELADIWQRAFIVLDTSVLLNLYRYPDRSRDDFLRVLDLLRDRLWSPHQVALEFQARRQARIPAQRTKLTELAEAIRSIASKVDRLPIPDRHPTLDAADCDPLLGKIRLDLEDLVDLVEQRRELTPQLGDEDLLTGDVVFDAVTALFDGRTGPPFNAADIGGIQTEGEQRYQKEVPPGYKDGIPNFGDLIIWKQCLARAKSEPSQPMIFVTDDRKEDWWWRHRQAVLGPRRELLREFIDEVGELFHMYLPEDFLRAAAERTLASITAESLTEIESLRPDTGIASVLRWQRMILPPPDRREWALSRIYDAWSRGEITVVDDLNNVINELGDEFRRNEVGVPLFFALVNEAYGPVPVQKDPDVRLRDRSVSPADESLPVAQFVEVAHSAWLAQALYRLRNEEFSRDDYANEVFAGDAGTRAWDIIDKAYSFVETELDAKAQ